MRQPCAANSSGELRSGSATMNGPVATRMYADIVYSTVRGSTADGSGELRVRQSMVDDAVSV